MTNWDRIKAMDFPDAMMALTGIVASVSPDYTKEELIMFVFPKINAHLSLVMGQKVKPPFSGVHEAMEVTE